MQHWQLCLTASGAAAAPDALDDTCVWHAAPVPGTVAGALGAGERFDDRDAWYRCDLEADGPVTLRFDGLATLAEIWLDDTLLQRSDNMFVAHAIDVDLRGSHRLAICFRSLQAHLQKPGKRARWRPRMIRPPTLNAVRTTILGHAESWCPPLPPVGPWRDIRVEPRDGGLTDVSLHSELDDTTGFVTCSFRHSGTPASLVLGCAGQTVAMASDGDRQTARLALPRIEPWWPHTHGRPALHEVTVTLDGHAIIVGRVGFRNLRIDRGADGDGFQLICNDVPIFCRGACWTPVDLLRLPQDRATIEPRLTLAVQAGMNMLRIGGTMVYESDTFYRLCDELGLLVWQDFMFANFDYPGTADFIASVEIEATQFLRRTRASPCIAVLSGGSEVYQQAAMMGLPRDLWLNPIFEDLLPRLCARHRPDAAWVSNSPSGGVLPFVADRGVSHYYGVGAYRRPLEDARRADVRFTSECLAFAGIAEESVLPAEWASAVPRDAGADWDFADVRDHYLHRVFGCDAAVLRDESPARYREASRAALAHVMRTTLSEWRRAGSRTAGALVWFLSDLEPGSGWGLLDVDGNPKSGWFALQDCQQPLQVLVTDEGVNGLDLHLINETAVPVEAQVRLTCLRDGAVRVAHGAAAVLLAPRATLRLQATAAFGAFFDTTYAYRFGPAAHDVAVAELCVGDAVVSASSHFPLGLDLGLRELGLAVQLDFDGREWSLLLTTQSFARFVQIESRDFRPAENWFHLAPQTPRRVCLSAAHGTEAPPSGRVRALNGVASIAFG